MKIIINNNNNNNNNKEVRVIPIVIGSLGKMKKNWKAGWKNST